MTSLEDWEKQFVKSENLEQQELEGHLSKISKYCSLSQVGFVVIQPAFEKILNMKDKIHLVLCARYIAHELQVALGRENPISADVSADELARNLMIGKSVITARASDLRKEHKIMDSGKGVYKATLQGIKPFLEHLQGESK